MKLLPQKPLNNLQSVNPQWAVWLVECLGCIDFFSNKDIIAVTDNGEQYWNMKMEFLWPQIHFIDLKDIVSTVNTYNLSLYTKK